MLPAHKQNKKKLVREQVCISGAAWPKCGSPRGMAAACRRKTHGIVDESFTVSAVAWACRVHGKYGGPGGPCTHTSCPDCMENAMPLRSAQVRVLRSPAANFDDDRPLAPVSVACRMGVGDVGGQSCPSYAMNFKWNSAHWCQRHSVITR